MLLVIWENYRTCVEIKLGSLQVTVITGRKNVNINDSLRGRDEEGRKARKGGKGKGAAATGAVPYSSPFFPSSLSTTSLDAGYFNGKIKSQES